MLSSIKELHAEYLGYSPNQKSVDHLASLKIAKQLIRAMAKEAGIPGAKHIRIKFENFNEDESKRLTNNASCYFKRGKTYVHLSPLILVDLDKMKGSSQEICNQVLKACNLSKHKVNKLEKYEIFAARTLLKNPQKLKEIIRYTINHELGHIYYHDIDSMLPQLFLIACTTILFIVIGLAFVFALEGLALAFPALTLMSPVIIGIACVVNLIFQIIVAYKVLKSYNHFKEFRADIFSAKKFDAEGGIYWQKFMKKYYDNKSSFTHPKNSLRISHLRALRV